MAKVEHDLVEAQEGEIRHTDFGKWAPHGQFENEVEPAFAAGFEQVDGYASELGPYWEFQEEWRDALDEMVPDEAPWP